MKNTHVLNLVSDYVLELLPGEEKQLVEHHLAICADCRRAVGQERQIGVAVRATVMAASRPSSTRLQQLMPAVPGTGRYTPSWQRQLAPFCLLLLLTIALLGNISGAPFWSGPASTFRTATATTTNTPTATATNTIAAVDVSLTTEAKPPSWQQRPAGAIPSAGQRPAVPLAVATPAMVSTSYSQ